MNEKYKKLKKMKNEMELGYETLQYLMKEFFVKSEYQDDYRKDKVIDNYREIGNLLRMAGDYFEKVYEKIKEAHDQAEREWMEWLKGPVKDEEEA